MMPKVIWPWNLVLPPPNWWLMEKAVVRRDVVQCLVNAFTGHILTSLVEVPMKHSYTSIREVDM